MGSSILLVDVVLGGLGLYLIKVLLLTPSKKAPAPLPPGPKPKPVIGNLLDLPPAGEQEWVFWAKHKELYGPISSVNVFGQNIIILNEARIAYDLLEKRSATYSDRPTMVFGGEMCGWEHALSSQHYTDRFRAYRKNIHAVIGSKSAVSRFYPLQDTEVRRFLLRVLEEPEKLEHHIRTEAGAIILKISHGYTIEPREQDPLVNLADEALAQFSSAVQPGAWLVDVLPILRHVPDWVPGTGFKRTALRWKRTVDELAEKPHEFVKQQMAAGTAIPSYTSALLEKGDLSPEEDFVVKWSATSLYSGGADTTVSSMYCFFLAMTLFPEKQRKAQEEIDRVVGSDRLPGFEDRADLPYVNALVKEILRWHPVAPMGLPHQTIEDDIYEGMFIPKGSLLMANIWGFMHDPATFHDPMTFKPERFLGVDGRAPEMDTHSIAFGFGRRVCPGRELADSSVFLSIAMSLAAFDIRKPAAGTGKAVDPVAQFTPGIISHPVSYKTSITPRSAKAEALIRAVEEEHPFESNHSGILSGLKWEKK
ncbi:cytochrome P450 [Phellopilus nigrolimitatus]|nr:cytochrome P450 [Phellopilus nigrolimitatus]